MLNVITIQGRLTRDPELRHTTNGTAVASFALAVDRDYTSKDGGERETDFVDIVAWRGTAEFVSKYFTKGQLAIVSGRLQIRHGRTTTGISAEAPRSSRSTCILAAARKKPAARLRRRRPRMARPRRWKNAGMRR